MPNKYALIIGNTEYTDPGLAQLTAPGKDAEDFARALKSPEIAAFDEVATFVNEGAYNLKETIEGFFTGKKPDDLLVFYFSGHGVRDESGWLYLAVKNTNRLRLRSTAIEADFVSRLMDQSRSRRQVVILDCCNSGAFAQGTKAETGGAMGIAKTFEGIGYGRVVLTATDATQFAWEGDKIIGDETTNSLFTHFLVKGLEGEADEDGDGKITVDELYDYAYEQIVSRTPKQTPGKWSYKQQGEIVLRQNTKIENIKPMPLPVELIAAMKNSIPYVREGAIRQLENLLKGKNLGLARPAREALEKIAAEDDSRRVAQLAAQILDSFKQAELEEKASRESTEKAKQDADRLATQKAEEERLAQAKIETERKAKQEAERLVAQKAEEERIARAKIEAERKAKEKADRLTVQKRGKERQVKENLETAEKAKLENEKRPPQKAEQKKLARSSLPIALGGFGLLLVVCACVAGVFLVADLLSSPTAPVLTQAPIPIVTPIATMISDRDGATLVYVPEGEFTMGSNNGRPNEEPVHKVNLDAFWIDQTEVTNAMYAKCVDAGKCDSPSSTGHFNNSSYANHPVVYVDWNKANAYCSWAGRRLPTESEWEKAARGTDMRIYPWGNSIDCSFANYFGKSGNNACVGDTTKVGSYESGKSPYGTYDMAGNVWEWVNDWYSETYYQSSPSSNPLGPDSGDGRVIRGGSLNDDYSGVRSVYRIGLSPDFTDGLFGFRCALSP